MGSIVNSSVTGLGAKGMHLSSQRSASQYQANMPDDEVFAKGLDGVEKSIGLGRQIAFEDGLALGGEDVHEHGSGVQINAGVELVWLVIVRHVGLLVCDGSS